LVNPRSGESDKPADARESINRVLEAEKRMVRDLDHCRERAGEIVENARARARRILRRTEERIRLLHHRWDEEIEAKVRTIESSFDGPAEIDARDRQKDNDRLHYAVDRLAEALTTAERDDF
jgi:vacuolar-type H+-ATPase subunit H